MLVFLVSVASHYAALFALLWFGQMMAIAEGLAFDSDVVEIGVIAAGLQVVGFLLVISPLGYMFQKAYYPVRKLSIREEDKLRPLLEEVMAAYKDKKHARINRVELFIMDDPEWNASAFGKKNIAITSGLVDKLKWRDEALKAVLAHELGHLHHRDLWFWHYVDAAGGILAVMFGILGMVQKIATVLSDLFLPFIIVSLPLQMIYILFSYALNIMKLPVNLLAKVETYLSRKMEYRADNFAADLIGTKGVISFLETIKKIETYMEFGFLNMKRRTHPPSEYRIEKLHAHPSYEPHLHQPFCKPVKKECLKKKRKTQNRVYVMRENYPDNNLNRFIEAN